MLDRLADQAGGFLGRQDRRIDPGRLEPLGFARNRIALAVEGLPARIVDHAQGSPGLGQAHVGIVLAQLQAVFGAAGEHAVGLGDAARDQVVDQHAEVGFVPPRAPGFLFLHLQRRVDAGQQALRGRLFVAGGAVDLPGEKQARRWTWFRAKP